MVETVREMPVVAAPEGGLRGPRISWGAIFGGAVSALGLWLLLYAFGLAVGLSTVDTAREFKASGIFTGIWGLLSPLIALFVGGFIAGRMAGIFTRFEGLGHGLVMWGLATVGGAWMVAMTLTALLGGVASLGKSAIEAGGSAIGAAAGTGAANAGDMANAVGLDADDILAPVNQRLSAEGKPTVTAAQLRAASKDAVQKAVRGGGFDREQLITALTQNTNLSRADAEEIATRAESRWESAKGQAQQKLQGAEEAAKAAAVKAAHASGKAFWGVFGALFLGLIAALAGGALGVPRLRTHRYEPGGATAPPRTRVPVTPRREVYP